MTFDDGYKDIYFTAYPVLRKYGAPATVFLTTGHIGTGELFWWDKIGYVIYNSRLDRIELNGVSHSLRTTEEKRKTVDALLAEADTGSEDQKKMLINNLATAGGVKIPDGLGEELILSWSEIQAMSNDGIDFGAHTVTHPVLTRVSLEQAKYEIFQSKVEIENRLNKQVTAFAYPRGMAGDFNAQTVELLKQA
ncbi:MAG: polysaccharide deacetylase family protein, partial [Candidatus Bathyarchaeota archaeon]|nr:polysaccharide deacetylase family protein [Candidatus Bathyarchaeota archaeon]